MDEDGTVLSACRYVNASSAGIQLPLGLGSRHLAAASITRETGAIAVVVSESSVVRVFDNGAIVSEIIPELWLLERHDWSVEGPRIEESNGALRRSPGVTTDPAASAVSPS